MRSSFALATLLDFLLTLVPVGADGPTVSAAALRASGRVMWTEELHDSCTEACDQLSALRTRGSPSQGAELVTRFREAIEQHFRPYHSAACTEMGRGDCQWGHPHQQVSGLLYGWVAGHTDCHCIEYHTAFAGGGTQRGRPCRGLTLVDQQTPSLLP